MKCSTGFQHEDVPLVPALSPLLRYLHIDPCVATSSLGVDLCRPLDLARVWELLFRAGIMPLAAVTLR